MKFLVAVFAIAVLLIASSAVAGTSLSGSLAGAWVLGEDNTASALAAGLGATYRPDVVEPVTVAPKYKIVPSDLVFFTQQYFNDGSPDINVTGVGLSIFKAPNFELLAEVGAVFKGIENDKFRVGGLGQIQAGFPVLGQPMNFRCGGGYDGDRPMLILSLGFATQ